MANTPPAEHGGMTDAGRIPRITPEDVLAEFTDRGDRAEPLTAPELADALDCSRRTALNKLHDLADRGEVASKKVGGRAKVWWVPLPQEPDHGQDRRETPAREPAGETNVDDGSRRERAYTPQETPPFADVVDEIAEHVLPGSGAKLEARREALHAAVEYLREHGRATPKDFQTDIYPEHPGRYTDGEDPAYSWWTNCIYKGFRELAERTELVEKADTTGEWSWRGESA